MSRKDYVAIAGVLATIRDAKDRERVAMGIARLMQADNPASRPGKFLAACSVTILSRDQDGFTAVLRK